MIFLYAVIAANAVIFILWQLSTPAGEELLQKKFGKSSRELLREHLDWNGTLAQLMAAHFTLNERHWKATIAAWRSLLSNGNGNGDGASALRASVALARDTVKPMLLASMSQQTLLHFASNMIVLGALAPSVLRSQRAARFMALYFGSIVACNVAEAYGPRIYFASEAPVLRTLRADRSYTRHFLGASGAVSGVAAAYALLFPRRTLLLYGFVPVKAYLLIGAVFAFDLYATHRLNRLVAEREREQRAEPFYGLFASQQKKEKAQQEIRMADRVANMGHMGGMSFGFIFIALLKLKRLR